MTNETIVFGFGNADAFAQALGWPQTGIAMLMKGECLSENANDVFMLNGFIYDANLLTVAANFSQSAISNISTNVNITFGPNNTTNTTTTDSTISGNPQPYSANVQYVSASFFGTATASLNSTYYSSLNASSDSLLDDESGCYYNSFSQALLYDIVDGRNYNDKKAYNKLVDSVASNGRQNISNIDDVPEVHDAINSDDDNITVLETFDVKRQRTFDKLFELARERVSKNQSATTDSNGRRRRRRRRSRSSKQILVEQVSIRRKRAWWSIFEDIGNAIVDTAEVIGEGVVDAFETVADVVETAVDTVSEIGQLVATAIFGGVYEKNAQINLEIGSDKSIPIYTTPDIQLTCLECNIRGTVDIHGRFDFGKNGIETVLNEGYVEATGNIIANAVGGLFGSIPIEKGFEVGKLAFTPINIPGVFTLGPQAILEVGVSIKLGDNLEATFGAHVTWDRIYTKVDMKNPSQSVSTGWSPTKVEPQFSFSTEIIIEIGIYVQPKIELALDVFDGTFKAAAGLSATGTIGGRAEYSQTSDDCPDGIGLNAFISMELAVYAELGVLDTNLLETEYPIFETEYPLTSVYCIAILSATTEPSNVATTLPIETSSPTTQAYTQISYPDTPSVTSVSTAVITSNSMPPMIPSTDTLSQTPNSVSCDICCDVANIDRTCQSNCYCSGPGLDPEKIGIVGYYICKGDDPSTNYTGYTDFCPQYTTITRPTTTLSTSTMTSPFSSAASDSTATSQQNYPSSSLDSTDTSISNIPPTSTETPIPSSSATAPESTDTSLISSQTNPATSTETAISNSGTTTQAYTGTTIITSSASSTSSTETPISGSGTTTQTYTGTTIITSSTSSTSSTETPISGSATTAQAYTGTTIVTSSTSLTSSTETPISNSATTAQEVTDTSILHSPSVASDSTDRAISPSSYATTVYEDTSISDSAATTTLFSMAPDTLPNSVTCDICCDVSYINRTCQSICNCSGPGMGPNDIGIVGYYVCIGDDPTTTVSGYTDVCPQDATTSRAGITVATDILSTELAESGATDTTPADSDNASGKFYCCLLCTIYIYIWKRY